MGLSRSSRWCRGLSDSLNEPTSTSGSPVTESGSEKSPLTKWIQQKAISRKSLRPGTLAYSNLPFHVFHVEGEATARNIQISIIPSCCSLMGQLEGPANHKFGSVFRKLMWTNWEHDNSPILGIHKFWLTPAWFLGFPSRSVCAVQSGRMQRQCHENASFASRGNLLMHRS